MVNIKARSSKGAYTLDRRHVIYLAVLLVVTAVMNTFKIPLGDPYYDVTNSDILMYDLAWVYRMISGALVFLSAVHICWFSLYVLKIENRKFFLSGRAHTSDGVCFFFKCRDPIFV